jgi:adenosine kinase
MSGRATYTVAVPRILVTGSAAYDLLLSYDGAFADAFKGGKDASLAFVTPHFARHHGGTGVNAAWNLQLLGADPLLVATVGQDGGPYRALLEERGIDTAYLEQVEKAMTSTAIITTDNRERQITFFHPGADALGSWPDLSEERDDVACALVAPREERVMLQATDWCRTYGVPFYFDPGQRLHSFADGDLDCALHGSAGVFCNEAEWAVLSGRLGVTERSVLERTGCLIVTRGEKGASIFTDEGALDIPACPPDQTVNPTGAGDGFRAGFLTGIAAGWSLVDASRLACSAASFIVEIEGTLLDTLDREAVWQRASETYGEELPSLS